MANDLQLQKHKGGSIIIIAATMISYYTDLLSLVPSAICSAETPAAASSVDDEALLNRMALLSGEIGVSRRNFIANHLQLQKGLAINNIGPPEWILCLHVHV